MKKTMFITSVVMVVVMAIALTTSSLAWFTAAGATSVTTSTLTLQAKANASTGLLLCNDAVSFSTTSVRPALAAGSMGSAGSGTIADLQPVGLYGETVLEALAKTQFTGSYVDNTTGTALWATDSAYSDHYAGYVYVANSGDADVHIKADINFDDVEGATLFVAVLAKKEADNNDNISTSEATDWEIVRVASSNGSSTVNSLASLPLSAEEIDADDAVGSQFAATNFTACTGNYSTTSVGGKTGNNVYDSYQQFLIVAWYSADLTNTISGATETHGDFTVTFSIGA